MTLGAEAGALWECDLQHIKQLMGSGDGGSTYCFKVCQKYNTLLQRPAPHSTAAKLPRKQGKNLKVKDNSHREPSKS